MIVTAAFGEPYRWAARGLLASLAESNPGAHVVVFSDAPMRGTDTVVVTRKELLDRYPAYYRHPRRANVAKFVMIETVGVMHSPDDLLWIDADTLVFSDFEQLGMSGALNLMRHGSRREETINCGNGLLVPGSDYAIGSPWGIPNSKEFFDFFDRIVEERLSWPDADDLQSGDQILMNHLRRAASAGTMPGNIHWFDEATNDILNYQLVSRKRGHPKVGRENYRHVRLRRGSIFAGERRVGLWTWTAPTLFAHRETGFRSFRRRVKRRLRALYG